MKQKRALRISIFTISVFHLCYYSFAQCPTFQMKYGGSTAAGDNGYSVFQTTDGGFGMIGRTQSLGSNNFYIVKTDGCGVLQWSNVYGTSANTEYTQGGTMSSDGGFIVAGYLDQGAGVCPCYPTLFKTDAFGTVQWGFSYGGTKMDQFFGIDQTSDGGYIALGYTNTYGVSNNPDYYLLRTDANGNFMWSKTSGLGNWEYGYCVRETTDGGFILTGASSSAALNEVFLVKTNSAGTVQWSYLYGGTKDDYGYAVEQTTDGGYIITGFSQSNFPASAFTNNSALLIKTDPAGTVQWAKRYQPSGLASAAQGGVSVRQTTDGGYTVLGYSYGGFGVQDAWLFKTDAAGTLQWSNLLGGSAAEYTFWGGGNLLSLTSDGGYIATLQTSSFGGGADAYLIKTDATGASGCNSMTIPFSEFTITPWLTTSNYSVTPGTGASSATSIALTTNANVATVTTILCQVLSVEWLDFFGKILNFSSVELHWETASESNNDYFEIEQSSDGVNFALRGKIQGAGNSTFEKNYSFIDEHLFSGVNYYRLKQVDYDGNFTYSKTISINNRQTDKSIISIYPVPSENELHCEFYSARASEINISVADVVGNVVKNEKVKAVKGMNDLKLNINELPQGMYFLKAGSINEQSQVKFIKQ